jgi:hypothetical protein
MSLICPFCSGTGESPPMPTAAVEGGPRCDYRTQHGQQCLLTPHHARVYPHRVDTPPITLDEDDD